MVAADNAIDSVSAVAYTIPTDAPGEADGTLRWDSTTLVVVTASCDGVSGLGYTYGPASCAQLVNHLLAGEVRGLDPMGVQRAWSAMVAAARNAPRVGAVSYAISAVDVALWDLKARLLEVSLGRLLGQVHETVSVYGSGGFTTYTDDQTAAQLASWIAQGMTNVKIKIGEDAGRSEQRDVERIRLARAAVGPDVGLFVDANGAYSRKQAVRVIDEVAAERVVWFEEPVTSDDLAGLREVRAHVACDVTAGEYGTDAFYFRRMCAEEAVDCLQIDATRCGGYTGWLRAAAVAASHGLEVSAHCAPNLHAHIGAATPHLRHVEWFHDHARIEGTLLRGALAPSKGHLRPDVHVPGHGLTIDHQAAAPYQVSA